MLSFSSGYTVQKAIADNIPQLIYSIRETNYTPAIQNRSLSGNTSGMLPKII